MYETTSKAYKKFTRWLYGPDPVSEWVCPDWKSYTNYHRDLRAHEKILADQGLKDPWIRNYAWRYSPKIYRSNIGNIKAFFLWIPSSIILAITYNFAIKYVVDPELHNRQHLNEQLYDSSTE